MTYISSEESLALQNLSDEFTCQLMEIHHELKISYPQELQKTNELFLNKLKIMKNVLDIQIKKISSTMEKEKEIYHESDNVGSYESIMETFGCEDGFYEEFGCHG